MTQPPSEPDAHQENEPLHADPNKAHSAANSLHLSQDATQPPSEPDAHQDTEPLDKDQDKEPVPPSSRCSVNSLNLSQDATQPPSEPDAHQETEPLDMDQDKEPVLPSSRGSVNSLNLSQGSQQSTLPPPASQQSSSGFPLSLRNNNIGKYDPAYGESSIKLPKRRRRRSNTISETSKMKQIKETHKHLYQLLKNANVLAQSDRNLLANAKQMLFSIKLHHAVLCESLKSDCLRKVPSNNGRETLKKRISLLQNRQHKLLLLFQEHNVITKKIKTLDSDCRRQAEIAAKEQRLLSRLTPKNLRSFSKSKTFTKNFKPESESASTIYSFDCSQKKKPKFKKTQKKRDSSVLRKSQQSISQLSITNRKMNPSSQQPMSESAMISGNKMNSSSQQPMSESSMIFNNKMNQSSKQPMSASSMILNKMNQSSQQPMSESSMISDNKMNQSSQQPMSESSMIFNNKMNQSSKQPMSASSMILNKMNQSSQQPMSESSMISDNKMNQSSQQPMSESSMISDNKMNQSSQQPMSESSMIFNNKMNQSSKQPMSASSMILNKMNQSSQQPMSESSMISDNKMNQSSQQPMSESSMIFNNKMNQSSKQPMSASSMIFNKMNQSSQQPMSESSMISDNNINQSRQKPMSESAMISKNKTKCSKNKFPHDSKQTSSYPINIAHQAPKLDSKPPACPSWLNKNTTSNDASISSLPNCTQFSVTPIGTIADFTKKIIIQSQQDFSNDQLVPKPAVTSAYQQLQNPAAAGQHLRNVQDSSFGGDIFCTSTNSQTITANGARSLETCETTKEGFSVAKWQESTEESTKSFTDEASFDEADCEIAALTHLTLIEDQELVPLDRILPSCQGTDIFASINFPKFLWEGFYKWP